MVCAMVEEVAGAEPGNKVVRACVRLRHRTRDAATVGGLGLLDLVQRPQQIVERVVLADPEQPLETTSQSVQVTLGEQSDGNDFLSWHCASFPTVPTEIKPVCAKCYACVSLHGRGGANGA